MFAFSSGLYFLNQQRNSGKITGYRSHDKCIWKLDRNNLHSSVRQYASPSDLSVTFFSVSCLPQTLMLECLYFSPTTGSLYDDGCMTKHTICPVLAGIVLVLRALSRHPSQSTKMSQLGIQSARIVPHCGTARLSATQGRPIKCYPFHTSNLLTI